MGLDCDTLDQWLEIELLQVFFTLKISSINSLYNIKFLSGTRSLAALFSY